MANLAIVGSHSTNGVAAIHSELLRSTTFRDMAEMFPERFNNKTNGVTPRRWLFLANPALSQVITQAVGDGWITDLRELRKLKSLADDKGFRDSFINAKNEAKSQFATWLRLLSGQTVDPNSETANGARASGMWVSRRIEEYLCGKRRASHARRPRRYELVLKSRSGRASVFAGRASRTWR
jgi:glucan phosphorylase